MKTTVLSACFSHAIGALLLCSGLAHADTIYVSDANWGYGGASIMQFQPSGQGTVFADAGAYNPQGVAFDSSGNLYVAYYANNTIMKFSPSGYGSVFATSGVYQPEGLAFDSSGNLYAANVGTGTIAKFSPSGQASVFASLNFYGAGINFYSTLAGLAFDSSGNLWVASFDYYEQNIFGNKDLGGNVREFNPSGEQILQLSVTSPTGLAFDKNGNLFVSSWNNGTILKFDANDNSSVFASGLGYPDGLAFDSSGKLYVASVGNNSEILELDAAGDVSVFASGLSDPQYIAVQVPEPSTWAMLTLGVGAFLGSRRSASSHQEPRAVELNLSKQLCFAVLRLQLFTRNNSPFR